MASTTSSKPVGDPGADGHAVTPGGYFEDEGRSHLSETVDLMRGKAPISEATIIVAYANEAMTEPLRDVRKGALIQDIAFERISADGVVFGMKASGSAPNHRAKIWVTVPVVAGVCLPPQYFEDGVGERYPMTKAGIEQRLGVKFGDLPIMKRYPTAELSLIDRTLLPTVPARNFFSLARRKQADRYHDLVTALTADMEMETDGGPILDAEE